MTKTVDFTQELFADVMENVTDFFQTGETVCGSEDPAVIYVTGYKGFTVVRVVDRYVNPWKSDTLLEFSNRLITREEVAEFEELAGE